jgi:hypothetical protein
MEKMACGVKQDVGLGEGMAGRPKEGKKKETRDAVAESVDKCVW